MCSVCKDEQCHWGEYCYPSGKSTRPSADGIVPLKFTIQPGGATGTLTTTKRTLRVVK